MTTSEVERILNHAGAIGLLCELSVLIGSDGEAPELRDQIEQCVLDYCAITGGSCRRVLHRIEYDPPSREGE